MLSLVFISWQGAVHVDSFLDWDVGIERKFRLPVSLILCGRVCGRIARSLNCLVNWLRIFRTLGDLGSFHFTLSLHPFSLFSPTPIKGLRVLACSSLTGSIFSPGKEGKGKGKRSLEHTRASSRRRLLGQASQQDDAPVEGALDLQPTRSPWTVSPARTGGSRPLKALIPQ